MLTLDATGVDYDVFASSYYPYWHGSLDNLKSRLNEVADKYNKRTLIAEYSYYNSGNAGICESTFGPATPEGQTKAIEVINKTASEIPSCMGTFYWEPAWLNTEAEYWASEGTGWITANAVEYDILNKYIATAQGSGSMQYALFTADGHPLDAINKSIFKTFH